MTTTDTTTTTPAEELRTAADKFRTTAYAALSGPWQSLDDGDRLVAVNDTGRAWANVLEEPVGHAGTAAWIALANPALAEPLAALLEDIADEAERHAAQGAGNAQDEIADSLILNVARAINGSPA